MLLEAALATSFGRQREIQVATFAPGRSSP